jgi:hypothetical protein
MVQDRRMNTNRLATILVTLAAGLVPAASAHAAVDLGPVEQFRFPAGTGLPQIDSTLAAADFDGDGNVDLLGAGSDKAAFLAGDGEGGFDPARRDPLRTNGEYREIEPADLNGDGNLDLVVAQGDFEQSVATFLGNGDGTFTRRSATDLSEEPESVAVGDVDGDGDVDAVSTGFGNVQVLRNDGTGNLTADPAIDAPGNCCDAIALGRLDGDADLDVAAADPFGSLIVLLGDGAGGFAVQPEVPVLNGRGPYFASLEIADLNGDGAADVTVYNDRDRKATLHVLLGNGAGGFAVQPATPVRFHVSGGTGPDALTLADLDGDGELDAVVGGEDLDNGPVSILTGDGAGGFGDQVSFSAHMGPSALATGDFDEDGRADVAGANFYDALSVTTLLGGEGTTECRGEPAQYVGFAPGETSAAKGKPREDDVTNGSSADDVISTGAGEDAPFGNKGDDVICGGAGGDFIRSHVGDDVLVGGPGPDRLNGGSGNDVCIGGGGADKLHNCEEER